MHEILSKWVLNEAVFANSNFYTLFVIKTLAWIFKLFYLAFELRFLLAFQYKVIFSWF